MRINFHVIIKIFPVTGKRGGRKFLNGIAAIITALASLLIASYQIGLLPYNPENIQLNDESNYISSCTNNANRVPQTIINSC